jgi:hypothetical protein
LILFFVILAVILLSFIIPFGNKFLF